MEIPNRQSLEASFARRLERLNAKQRREVYAILGNPPKLDRLDEIDWAKFEREVESESMVALYLIFIASAGFHVGLTHYTNDEGRTLRLNAEGARWATERSRAFSKAYADGARAAVGRAVAKLRSTMAQRATVPAVAPAEPTFEIPQDAIDTEITKAIGPARAEQAAVNETTAAQSAGGEAGISETVGISQQDLWINRPELSTTGPCRICKPLHRQPRSVWGRIYPNGPGREVHEMCVCAIQYHGTSTFSDGLDSDGRTPLGESVENGKWRTINGNKVFIGDDGVILKGPKALAGKDLDGPDGEAKKQTDSKEFKAWFGDSKVVDKNGDPLVVYHGTPNAEWDKWDTGGKSRGDHEGGAIFATVNPERAAEYGYDHAKDDTLPPLDQAFNDATGRLASTVRSGQPYDAQAADVKAAGKALSAQYNRPDRTSTGQAVKPLFMRMENPAEVDAAGANHRTVNEKVIAAAKANGHDGVIIRNVVDNARGTEPHNVYVVFDPRQIKSATGNRGSFNRDSDSILESFR